MLPLHLSSGEELGNSVWPLLEALVPQAGSITVFNGVISVGNSTRPEGKSTLELSGRRPLSSEGARQLSRIIEDSATASLLTSLDLRFQAYPEISFDTLLS
jgi:hypothetical protein